MAAPTVVDFQSSSFTDQSSGSEVTPTVTWQAGDLILVIGMTADDIATLNTPTATGLTFSAVSGAALGIDASCRLYAWQATAAANGSSAITATSDGTTDVRGIAAFVYRGHNGLGNVSRSNAAESVSVRSLTRAGDDSAMVFALGDWTANTDVTVSATPSGTQRVAANPTSAATFFVFNYGGQGAAGTANVGITGFSGVTNNVMLAIEVKGTSAALTGTMTAGITEADIVAGGKTLIATLTGTTLVPAAGFATIQYVGGLVNSRAGVAAGSIGTQSLSGTLTGGIATSPSAGDLVIVFYGMGAASNNDHNLTIREAVSDTNYTLIGTELFANGTFDCHLRAAYRFMPATPDANFEVVTSATTADAQTWAVAVFRNVDPTTPIDVTPVTASSTTTRVIDPPAITPVTQGAVVLVGGSGAGGTMAVYTNPSSAYSGFDSRTQVDTNDSSIVRGYQTWNGSGAHNPPAFTGGGTNVAGDSHCVITIALRPAPTTPFADARSAARDGIVSAQSETNGWNAHRNTAIQLTNMVRTSDTVLTVTLSAAPGHDITAQEVLTWTLPGSIVASGIAIVATPTVTIDVAGGGTPVTAGTIASTVTFSAPTVRPVVTTGTRASALTLNAPTVRPRVTTGTRPSAVSVTAPSVRPRVTTGTRTSTAAITGPTVRPVVTTGTRASAVTMTAPTLRPVVVTGTRASTVTMTGPSLRQIVVMSTRSTTIALFGPTVSAQGGPSEVTTGTITAAAVVSAPSVRPTVTTGTRTSLAALSAPSVAPRIVTGTRTSTMTLSAPTLRVVITTGTRTSAVSLFSVSVRPTVIAAFRPSSAAFFTSSVLPRVTMGTRTSSVALFAVTVRPRVAGAFRSSTSVLAAPTVKPTITTGTRTSTATLFGVTVVAGSGILGATIDSDVTFFDLTITVRVTTAFRASTLVLSVPTIRPRIAVGSISSTSIARAPSVTSVVRSAFRSSTTTLYPVSLRLRISTMTISAGHALFAPSTRLVDFVTAATITSTLVLAVPQLSLQLVTAFIPSDLSIYAPHIGFLPGTPTDRIFYVPVERRTLNVKAETRVFNVKKEIRSFNVTR